VRGLGISWIEKYGRQLDDLAASRRRDHQDNILFFALAFHRADAFEVHFNYRHNIILRRSCGIQEKAPSLSRPVLVLRETTERPEGIEAGTARLVGTDIQAIFSAVQELLENPESYKKMISARNPYGDGNAAVKIVEVLQNTFG
jgi:UDP-N-acetylglucosamine 2-epimerase